VATPGPLTRWGAVERDRAGDGYLQKRITKSGEVRWDVRYRDRARGQRKRSFERKVDAQRFACCVETDLLRGDWIDPRRDDVPRCGGEVISGGVMVGQPQKMPVGSSSISARSSLRWGVGSTMS
jgi:hypothetical protein